MPDTPRPERRSSSFFITVLLDLALASAGFLSMLAHDSLPTTFVLYANYRYHWDERDIGLVLGAVGVAQLVVQGGLVGRLVALLGERKALAIGRCRNLHLPGAAFILGALLLVGAFGVGWRVTARQETVS